MFKFYYIINVMNTIAIFINLKYSQQSPSLLKKPI